MSESFVYAISDNEFIKIGVGRHPMHRLKQLQTGNVKKLYLLGFFSGGFELEKEIHSKFTLVRGEWMKPTKELIEFLNEKISDKFLILENGKVKSYMKVLL
jgi:hypothetical protein